jgi:hypothetical protein
MYFWLECSAYAAAGIVRLRELLAICQTCRPA